MGGAAGSLKSHYLLLDAMQEREHPYFRGLLVRQTFPMLTEVIEKTMRLYKPLGAEYNEQKKTWSWPSGATMRLGYMAADRDVYNYWGHEYSWVGFDESTLHTENQIRTILSRLRSPYAGLKLRCRLATNPGGPGASFHQQIFLNGACPIHEAEKCSVPGKLYRGRKWPSDGKEIPFSVAFIPGRLSDHNLLGDKYAEQLRMQQGSLADQLEIGCWCELTGAYFGKIWNKNKMVVPLASIGEQYWWHFWISIDYGFGKSWAAAGLYVRTPAMDGYPNGRMFKVGEICVPNTPAAEFAQMVVDAFVVPLVNGHRRNITVVYADPANFNANYDRRVAVGHSVSDQLNEMLEPFGLECSPATNDRIGRWQLIYRLLQTGEFAIADNCPMTAEAIRTRVHDEKKPGDILKIPGDNLDDVADETGYALYSFINAAEKPREMKFQERMSVIPKDDITSRSVFAPRIQAELEKEEQPIYLSRNPRHEQQMAARRRRF